MRFLLLTISIAFMVLGVVSCGDNHTHDDSTFEYKIDIISPAIVADSDISLAEDMNVGQSLDIKINFSSETGEKVHNVAVRIFKVDDESTLAYDFTEHVHADKVYTLEKVFDLTEKNNVSAHTDWILEAKVWGHEDGEQEAIQSIGFHVHPE